MYLPLASEKLTGKALRERFARDYGIRVPSTREPLAGQPGGRSGGARPAPDLDALNDDAS